MSARSRRFFGCCLPLTLAICGCGALLMLGYAGQVVLQLVRVSDRSMLPVLQPGWTVLVNNTAFWAQDPLRGSIVSVGSPEGLVFRRVFGVAGDTVEIRDGEVLLDGEPSRIYSRAHGDTDDYGPVTLGPDEYFVLAEDRDFDDSREWGPLARDEMYGVALFYFPRGSRSAFPVDPTPVPSPVPTSIGSP